MKEKLEVPGGESLNHEIDKKIVINNINIVDKIINNKNYQELLELNDKLKKAIELNNPNYKEELSDYLKEKILEDLYNGEYIPPILKIINFITMNFEENINKINQYELLKVFENKINNYFENFKLEDSNILKEDLKITYKFDKITNFIEKMINNPISEEKKEIKSNFTNFKKRNYIDSIQKEKTLIVIGATFYRSSDYYLEHIARMPKIKMGRMNKIRTEMGELNKDLIKEYKPLFSLDKELIKENFLKENIEINIEDTKNNKVYNIKINNSIFINDLDIDSFYMNSEDAKKYRKKELKNKITSSESINNEEINFGY